MNQQNIDETIIRMVSHEKIKVIINDKVTFDYNQTNHRLNIWIPSSGCPKQKDLFDQYEIIIYGIQHLKQYAAQYYLEHQEKIEAELKVNTSELKLNPYEYQGETATGYKILYEGNQIGTLEYRSWEWIGAVVSSESIVTMKNEDIEKVLRWIELMSL